MYTTQYDSFVNHVGKATRIGSLNSFARQAGYTSRYKTNLDKTIKAQSRINELILHKFASETLSYIRNPNPRKQPPSFGPKINLGAVDKQMVTIGLNQNVITMMWKVWDKELAFEFTLPPYILKRNISKISLPTVEYHKRRIVFIFTIQEVPDYRAKGVHLAGVDLGRVEPYTLVVLTKEGKRLAHYTTSPRLKQLNTKRQNLLKEKQYLNQKITAYNELGLDATVLVREKQFKTNKIKTIGVSLAQQVGAEITHKLKDHKINVLHIENLTWVTGKKYGSRWNHSKQQSAIQHSLSRAGIKTKKVNPRNTSQNCHKCGTKIIHNTRKRTVHCLNCKTQLDRDYNAAINVAKNKTRYPTMNRVSGGNHSIVQVVNHKGFNSIVAGTPAITSFIT